MAAETTAPLDRPWLTTEEAAKWTGTSLSSVLRAIRRGELRAVGINGGRVWRVHRDWADAWMSKPEWDAKVLLPEPKKRNAERKRHRDRQGRAS